MRTNGCAHKQYHTYLKSMERGYSLMNVKKKVHKYTLNDVALYGEVIDNLRFYTFFFFFFCGPEACWVRGAVGEEE